MPGLLDDLDGPLKPPAPVKAPPKMRDFLDVDALRTNIYDNVLTAAKKFTPIESPTHRLELHDVGYEGPENFSHADEKKAILTGGTLGRKLRGTWALVDKTSGAPIAKKRATLANVPWVSPLGTYILGGTDYTLASQTRLRPGVYARERQSGEIEAHVNVMPGKGLPHRIELDPETGIFKLNLSQSHVPLVPVLRAFGVKDADLRDAWGNELFAANTQKDDQGVLRKVFEKLTRHPPSQPLPDRPTMMQHVVDAFSKMELDPEVTQATLGQPFSRVDPTQILATTKKLLAIGRGEADVDDRDHLAYQTLHGPEDLFAERVGRDKATLRKLLWKGQLSKSLDHIPAGVFNRAIWGAITSSGLGMPSEGINPSMLLEQMGRVTRLGEGGIGSLDAVPEESRAVQPSHLGFVDPIVTPQRSAAI